MQVRQTIGDLPDVLQAEYKQSSRRSMKFLQSQIFGIFR
jgi:hypothetical protein